MNDGVEIRESSCRGLGLFAKKDFAVGEKVYSYDAGQIVRRSEICKLPIERQFHIDKVGDDRYEVLASPGCYLNHSCEPNAEEKNRTGYALRDIKKGDEITLDYRRNGIIYLEKPFRCCCGSKNCAGTIRGTQ